MADPGKGPKWPALPPPLFLDQNEAQRGNKIFFRDRTPPYLRVWMTAPPSYLKVWIHHCLVCCYDAKKFKSLLIQTCVNSCLTVLK